MNNSTESLSTNLISETVAKRPRGRPAKYLPEEREQKYKEVNTKWQKEHKEQYTKYQQKYYSNNSDNVIRQSNEYHTRARNALRLLTEMLEENIEISSDKYKELITELVKNKKIIYV